MVAELAALSVLVLAAGAELLHSRRVRRLAPLAFGPRRRPAIWASAAPFLRVASLAAVCWGLATLMLLEPRVHRVRVLRARRLPPPAEANARRRPRRHEQAVAMMQGGGQRAVAVVQDR